MAQHEKTPPNVILQWLITIAVFLTAIYFTVRSMMIPFTGLDLRLYEEGYWLVQGVSSCYPGTCSNLTPGDRIVKIGGLMASDAWQNYDRTPFGDAQPGDVIPLTVSRPTGGAVTVYWEMPVIDPLQRFSFLFSFIFVIPFLLSAGAVLYFVRPYAHRWGLLAMFFVIYALFLSTGFSYLVPRAQIYMRLCAWMLVPMAIHLHWEFPLPLKPIGRQALWWLYVPFAALAVADVLGMLPYRAYYISFIIQPVAAIGLLLVQVVRRRARSEALVMAAALVMAFTPGWVWIVLVMGSASGSYIPEIVSFITLVAFSLWPLVYVYANVRPYMLSIDSAARTIFIGAAFINVLLNATILMGAWAARLFGWGYDLQAEVWVYSSILSVTAVGLYFVVYRFLSYLLYGRIDRQIPLVSRALAQETPQMQGVEDLYRYVEHEAVPALEIEKSALYVAEEGGMVRVYSKGVETAAQWQAGTYEWATVQIPLKVQDELLGMWLVGKRYTTSFYSRKQVMELERLAYTIASTLLLFRQRQQMVAQRQVETAARLFASVVHAWATPLNSVTMALEMMEDGTEVAELRQLALENTQKIEEVLSIMRRVMRPSSGGCENVNDAIREAVDQLACKVHLHLHETEGVYGWMGCEELILVLGQLLRNAQESGGSVIVVESRLGQHGPVVVVTDNGRGIPLAYQQTVLEPFTTTGNRQGMGLFICHALLEMRGGKLTLRSQEGVGTAVTIELLSRAQDYERGTPGPYLYRQGEGNEEQNIGR